MGWSSGWVAQIFVNFSLEGGTARHRQAPGYVCIHISMCAPPRAPPPTAVRAPAEGYFAYTNLSVTVTVAALPHTWLCAHSCRCVCPPAYTPSHCSTWPHWGLFHSCEPIHSSPRCKSLLKWCARAHVFAFFRCITQVCICAPFRYRSRVLEKLGWPLRNIPIWINM